jgi:hypothetical protein
VSTFTQPALFEAMQQYQRSERKLLAEANASVVEWKFASEDMFGLFPLFDQIGFHADDYWRPANRRWLERDPDGFAYQHGFDTQGKVRIIKEAKGWTRLFTYFDEMVDEMRFGSRPHLKRYLLENGRTVALYDCDLNPEQYSHEIFEFDGNRCVKSVEQVWFVLEGKWQTARWQTTCEFEYDDEGLIRVFRDMGNIFGGRRLVYVRPKPKGQGKVRSRARRFFVGYSIIPPADGDPAQDAYSNAYGLEMTIDDEWPIDTVLLVDPSLVHVVTEDTGVTSMGTVFAGIRSIPADGDLKEVKAAGAQWALLDASEPQVGESIRAVLGEKLSVILIVSAPDQIQPILGKFAKVTAKQLVIAFRPKGKGSAEKSQIAASAIRKELQLLNCKNARVVIAGGLTKDNILEYLAQPDIDGALLEDDYFSATLDLLSTIGVNSR